MQNAETILNIIRSLGENNKPLQRVYRYLYNEDMYKDCSDNPLGRWNFIQDIKSESYRFDKQHKSNMIISKVLNSILTNYWSSKLSQVNRNCGDVLVDVRQNFRAVEWFLKIDFNNLLDRLLTYDNITKISKSIDDNRFIRFLSLCVENIKINTTKVTLSNTPINEPLVNTLIDIILMNLDDFIRNEISSKYNVGTKRKRNKQYRQLEYNIKKAQTDQDFLKVKQLSQQRRNYKTYVPCTDDEYRRLKFVRQHGCILLGLTGTLQDAKDISSLLKDFIKTTYNIDLNISLANSKSEYIEFLGYNIHIIDDDNKLTNGKRSINGCVGLRVPEKFMHSKISSYKKNGKVVHKPELEFLPDFDIVYKYGLEFKNIAEYYLLAYNRSSLSKLKWIMETSLLKTLAAKHKSSLVKMKRLYSTKLSKDGESLVCLKVITKNGVAIFGGISLKYKKFGVLNDNPNFYKIATTSIESRFNNKQCIICGSTNQVEQHHKHILGNLSDKPDWLQLKIAMSRKTISVCKECHNKIHSGKYDGPKL